MTSKQQNKITCLDHVKRVADPETGVIKRPDCPGLCSEEELTVLKQTVVQLTKDNAKLERMSQQVSEEFEKLFLLLSQTKKR